MDGDSHRLKIKIGPHEFEAEGPASVVNAQFEAFKELLADATIVSGAGGGGEGTGKAAGPTPAQAEATEQNLDKIMKVDGRIISLTVRPTSVEEAALLLLLGHKVLRKHEFVTGSELLDGLEATGGLDVARMDRIMEKAAADVTALGARRAKRYRLNNAGTAKALKAATDLIATVS